MNAWPAVQTHIYDGWIIRFAEGFTKRANSVNPLYRSKDTSRAYINDKIQNCENMFSSRNLPVVFKLTEGSLPGNLDKILGERGYQSIDQTSVQILYLDKYKKVRSISSDNNVEGNDKSRGNNNQDKGSSKFDDFEDIDRKFSTGIRDRISNSIDNTVGYNYQLFINKGLSKNWLRIFSRLSGLSKNQQDIQSRMLFGTTVGNYSFQMTAGSNTIACGLGVVENEYFGIYNIIVNKQYRGKGYGKLFMYHILDFAAITAEKAYLQVVVNNKPAVNLYKVLGFEEIYKYWYRIRIPD